MSDVTEATITPVKKVAFMARPYESQDRIKKEEDEIEKLLEEQQSKNNEQTETQQDDDAELNAEEKTFKQRYSDLRRHQQKQADEHKNEILKLKEQLSLATKKEFKLPKTDIEIEEWAKQYPDVAAIVETIAIRKASEQTTDIENKLRSLDEERLQIAKEKAETELYQLHPDFDSVRNSDKFHSWAEEQPKWIQQALYENDTDAQAAARAIDLYKADTQKINDKLSKDSKDAAKSVRTRGERSRPTEVDTSGTFKESDVEKMSTQEYERNSEAIMDAIRTGKFIYDLSGSAR
jgi:hypothetical protein